MKCKFFCVCVWICALQRPGSEASDWKWELNDAPNEFFSHPHRAGKVKLQSVDRALQSKRQTRGFRFPENKQEASERIKQVRPLRLHAALNEGAYTEHSTPNANLEERDRLNASIGFPQIKVVSSFAFRPVSDHFAPYIPYKSDIGELFIENPESNFPISFSENDEEQNIEEEVNHIRHLVEKNIKKKNGRDGNPQVQSKMVYNASSVSQAPSYKKSQILDILRRQKHVELNEVEHSSDVLKSKIESLIWLVLNSDLNASETAVDQNYEQYGAPTPSTTETPRRKENSGNFSNFIDYLSSQFPNVRNETSKHLRYSPWTTKPALEKMKREFDAAFENPPETEIDSFQSLIHTRNRKPNYSTNTYDAVQDKVSKNHKNLLRSLLKHPQYETQIPNATRESSLEDNIFGLGSPYVFPSPVYSAFEILKNFARTKNLDSFTVQPLQFFNNVTILALDSDRWETENIHHSLHPLLKQARRVPKHDLSKESETGVLGGNKGFKFLFYQNSVEDAPDTFITIREDFPTDASRNKQNATESTYVFRSTSGTTTHIPISIKPYSQFNFLYQNFKNERGSSNANRPEYVENKSDVLPIPPAGQQQRQVSPEYAIVRPPSIPVPVEIIHEVYPSSKEDYLIHKTSTTECYTDDCFRKNSRQLSKFDGTGYEENTTDPAEVILSCGIKKPATCIEGKLRWTWLPAFVNNGIHFIGEGKDVYSLDPRFQLRPCNKIGTESKLVIKDVNKVPSLRGEYMCQFRRCGEKDFFETQKFIV